MPDSPPSEDSTNEKEKPPVLPLIGVFVALIACTILSVVFDVFRPENFGVLATLVLSVATAKALFVMVYFMHLKFEGRWKWVILLPTVVLAIGLPISLAPDIGIGYYEPERVETRDGGGFLAGQQAETDSVPRPRATRSEPPR